MSKRFWTLVTVAAIAAACDSPVAPVTPSVHDVVVDPATHTLVVGDTVRVNARATTQSGQPVSVTMSWSSEADTVAVVRAQGGSAVIEAKRPGTTRIVAEAGGRLGRTTITVVSGPPDAVHHIDLTPQSGQLNQGEDATMRAQLRAADGSPLTGRAIQWSSTDTTVLVVTPGASGDVAVVRARAAGSARVRVHSEGIEAFAPFEVSDTGQPQQRPVAYIMVTPQQKNLWEDQSTTFHVRTLDSSGTELSGRTVDLSVENQAIAVIDAGYVRALGEGTTRIVAESEGIRGYATLYVYEQRQQMSFQMTYDWRDGNWHPHHQVGTTTWTDGNGAEQEVPLYATSGVFTVDFDQQTWTRVILAEAWATVDGQGRIVGTASYTGEGQIGYRWHPTGYMSLDFVESAEPREVYSGVMRPGELLVGLPVLGGLADYLFRIGG